MWKLRYLWRTIAAVGGEDWEKTNKAQQRGKVSEQGPCHFFRSDWEVWNIKR
jgi:hypothetical protein